MTFFKGVT